MSKAFICDNERCKKTAEKSDADQWITIKTVVSRRSYENEVVHKLTFCSDDCASNAIGRVIDKEVQHLEKIEKEDSRKTTYFNNLAWKGV